MSINLSMETTFEPCPFCGSTELAVELWCDDEGEFDAVYCVDCKGSAPAEVWDKRAYCQE